MKTTKNITSRILPLAAGLLLAGTFPVHAVDYKHIQLYATMSTNGYYTESQMVGGGGAIGFSDGDDADSLFEFGQAVFSTGAGGSYITGTRAGTAINVFPYNQSFNWGVIGYDADLLTGGSGTVPIVVAQSALDVSDSIDQGYTGTGLAEVFFDSECPLTFSNLSGTVTFVNGTITSVNLTASVHFNITAVLPPPWDEIFGPIIVADYDGSFSISGSTVQFSMNDTDYYGLYSSTFIWDLPGTLYPVKF